DTDFAQPLVVSVTANNPVEPVAGATVTFTAPVAGASALLSDSTAIIGSDGKASVTAIANGTAGSYVVSASVAAIASTANFSLGNTASPSLMVTTLLDDNNPSGTNSLR